MATSAPNRRQSTRNPRTSTTRPLNYYARPFGNQGSGAPSAQDPNAPNSSQHGFFPAITHFTDAVDALPQEMIRHFSMLKEVEAKIYQPDEELQRLVDAIAILPPPPKTYEPAHSGRFPGLSAQNSVRNGSIRSVSANSAAAQVHAFLGQQMNGIPATPIIDQNDAERQHLFTQLRYTIMAMSPMLDEKNAVLSTANQTLKAQLERMESSYKHVGSEISPEARYGSRTHWAYHAEKEPVKKPGPERTRREAGNNYVPADPEMAARSEARREAVKEAKKKRAAQHQPDSDFDDAPVPKKAGKGRKPGPTEADGSKSLGLGISNGTSVNGAQQGKKRKAMAGAVAAAPAMERSLSAAMRGAAAQNSRETPNPDQGPKKRAKPAAPAGLPKKRQAATPRSPHPASSPAASGVQPKEITVKPATDRAQHGTKYNLPPSLLSEVTHPLPSSPLTNHQVNGFGIVAMDVDPAERPDTVQSYAPVATTVIEAASNPEMLQDEPTNVEKAFKEEELGDALKPDADVPVQQVISTTRSGRGSKAATPLTGTFPNLSGLKSAKNGRKEEANGSGDNSHASSDSGHPERPSRKKGRNGSTSAASLLNEATGSRKSTPRAKSPVEIANDVIQDAPPASANGPVEAGNNDVSFDQTGEQPMQGGDTASMLEQPPVMMNKTNYPEADDITIAKELKPPTTTRTDVPGKLQKATSSRPSTSGKASISSKSHHNKDKDKDHTQSAPHTKASGLGRSSSTKKKDSSSTSKDDNEREQYDDLRNGRIPPDEPTYCYCNDVSYGQMIACDNEECPREWFHLKCTELDHVPDDPNWQWLCELCKSEREKDKGSHRGDRADREKEKNGKR